MDLQNYTKYTAAQLLEDASMREWLFSDYELTEAEVQILNQHPGFQTELKLAKEILLNVSQVPPLPQTDHAAFETLLEAQMRISKGRRNLRWIRPLAIAASFLLVFSAIYWLLPFSQEKVEILTFETTYGEWKDISLPDGSKVQLNANSKLVWSGGKEREVQLSGEAFFEVVKNQQYKTFTVFTDDLQVQVLGTRFNVDTKYEGTEVFLEEGKVKLLLENEAVELAPNQSFNYQKGQSKISQPQAAEAIDHSSWNDGIINIKNQEAGVCFTEIEKIYGLPFQYEKLDTLQDKKTLAVPIDNLEITLQILEQVFNVEITRLNDTLIVK